MTKHRTPLGPRTEKSEGNYRDILQKKANAGCERAKKAIKELGNRKMFDNYYS